jgi:hypothetical protein
MGRFEHVLLLLTVASFHIHLSDALYFHIAETERKCFIEEIPDETMVTGRVCLARIQNKTGRCRQLQSATVRSDIAWLRRLSGHRYACRSEGSR